MTDPAISAYYVVEAPGKGFSVQLHLGLIERLKHEILDASRRNGDEAGGILLGTILDSGRSVVIEDYQTVTRHLRKERCYDADLDRAALDHAISLWQSDPNSNIHAIGLFRSDGRSNLKPAKGDRASLTRHLPQLDSVLLLAGPERDDTAVAALYFAEKGQIRRGSPCARFPLDRSELAGRPHPEDDAGKSALRLVGRRREKDTGVRASKGYGLLSLRWVLILLAVAGLLGAALFEYRVANILSAQAGRRPASALGLKTERNGSDLLLSWNPAAQAFATAARGHLSITDGANTKELDLDLGDLRRGKIAYVLGTDDVTFRLEVADARQGKIADSLRVLSGTPPSRVASSPEGMPAASGSRLKAQDPGRIARESLPPIRQAMERTPVMAQAPGGKAAWQPQRQPAPVAQAVSRPDPAAPAKGEPVETISHAEPPDVNLANIRPTSTMPSSLDAPPPAPAALSPVAATFSARSAAPVLPLSQPGGAAPGSLRAGGKAEEAVAVRKTLPVYPALALLGRISGEVRVEVTVAQDGRVKSARAISGPSLLRQAAVKAVEEWRYKPALLNGSPVEATSVVEIVFRLRN